MVIIGVLYLCGLYFFRAGSGIYINKILKLWNFYYETNYVGLKYKSSYLYNVVILLLVELLIAVILYSINHREKLPVCGFTTGISTCDFRFGSRLSAFSFKYIRTYFCSSILFYNIPSTGRKKCNYHCCSNHGSVTDGVGSGF